MLGPFEIDSVIGVGGMGSVFRALHSETSDEVAIKVLRSDFANDVMYLEGFHREVRTMARMNHPGIVTVFDHGIIPREFGAARKEFSTGSPWIAMELVDGGSLEDLTSMASWAELKSLLLQVLDALAHAHARALVHRDLKPGNILRMTGETDRWLLTDFGITHIRDHRITTSTADVTAVSAGTPLYMSPEQVQGEWRDYGPWTDLYALGCIAYEYATGRPPFWGESIFDIVMQQVDSSAPPLKPRFPVPPGLENWIRRLMNKSITDRYRFAADAAADLCLLGEPEERPGLTLQAPPPPSPAHTMMPTPTLATLLEMPPPPTAQLAPHVVQARSEEDRFASGTEQATPLRPPRALRLPPTWDLRPTASSPPVLPGVGKGLFTLRNPPVAGRRQERDLLWENLRAVLTEGQTRCVILSGEAGLGKSRLMHWLSHRAAELGVAQTIHATHSPILNTTEGLPRAIQSHLIATGLSRRALFDRLQRAYAIHLDDPQPDPLHLGALVEWLSPLGPNEDEKGVPRVTLESPRQRHVLAETVLRQFAELRPLIFCIDDGHWAQDSLAFARHMIACTREDPLPLLILITLRPSDLRERPVEASYVELLCEASRTTEVPIPRLDEASIKVLLADMIGLDPALNDRVAGHCQGIPLFAVQMLEDWVHRDAIHPSPSGYLLNDDERLPSSLPALITERLEEAVGSYESPEQARVALQCAAVLGIDLDTEEWPDLCASLDTPLAPALIEHFLVRGILRPRDQGWRFHLPLYRDVLEDLCRDSTRWGLWAEINWRFARLLNERGGSAERQARHLLAGLRYREAIACLRRATEQRLQKSAYLQAISLLDLLEECLEEAPDPSAREFLHIQRAEALRFRGGLDQALGLLDEFLRGQPTPSLAARAEALRIYGLIEDYRGRYDAALQRLQRSREFFTALSDPRGLARVASGLGWVHANLGQLAEARAAFTEGFELATRARVPLSAAWCLQGLAEIALFSSDPDGLIHAEEALSLFKEEGSRSGMALIHRCLGDFARFEGDLPEARAHYRKARYLAGSSGSVHAFLPRLLLAVADVEEQSYDRAAAELQRIARAGDDALFPMYRPLLTAGLLITALHTREADLLESLPELLQELPPRSPLSRDLAMLLSHAGQLAAASGRQELEAELCRRAGALISD